MSAETTLKQLFPLELGGEHEATLAVDGRSLDAARQSIDTLLREVFPDTTSGMLPDWERVLGLSPGADDPVIYRLEQVVRKMRERGGLSISYFIELAASIGYAISIEEPKPFMAGVGQAGQEVMDPLVIYEWGVAMPSRPVYSFTAGQSAAGDPLSWWDGDERLEQIFRDLKPAHTFCYFNYSG